MLRSAEVQPQFRDLCDVLRGVVSFGRLRRTTKLRAVRRCQSSPQYILLENECAARKIVVQSKTRCTASELGTACALRCFYLEPHPDCILFHNIRVLDDPSAHVKMSRRYEYSTRVPLVLPPRCQYPGWDIGIPSNLSGTTKLRSVAR